MPKININGMTREMTAEELDELVRMEAEMPAVPLTPEERFSVLEEENRILKGAIEALLAGVNA